MKIPTAVMPYLRLTTVLAFVGVCAVIFGYLWTGAGGRIPLVSERGYLVSVTVADVDNLVNDSDVMVAGVRIGKVAEIEPHDDGTRVTMRLDSASAPLHEGATVTVRYKTLLQETFLEVTDGNGAAIPDGATLPDGSATQAVDLDDLLTSLDDPTREALAGAVRSLGAGTEDVAEDLAATLSGIGHIGREGKTVLAALSDQSDQLRELTANTATLVAALDTRRGRITDLVADANRLTETTAEGAADIEAVMRLLPGVLDTARDATGELNRLADDLGPVAANLDAAAPDLTSALRQLPETAADLRGLLPSLDGVLDNAPDTLRRLPAVSSDVRELIPNARAAMADISPMVAYLRPYGRDVAAWFANTNAAGGQDPGGYHARFTVPTNEQSVKGIPGGTEDLSPRRNPYPGPGEAERPKPFEGEYPRVEKEGR